MSWLLLRKNLFVVPVLGLALLALVPSCEQPAAGLGTKVDLTAPVIQVNGDLGPSPGAYVSDNERFWINASDDSGIEEVNVSYAFSAAGENGGLVPQGPFTIPAQRDEETGLYYVDLDTSGMADGSLELQINARDGTGKTTSSDKLVYTVKNAPPVIELQIPRPQVESGVLKADASSHQVVINSFISGMFQDLAGVAPGYPQVRFWADDSGTTAPPVTDAGNAGYAGVIGGDGADDGWISVDTGLVISAQGERGNAFRYYLRNHRANGSYPADEEAPDQIPIGKYSLQVRAKDIMGKDMEWPANAYDGSRDRMRLEIYAPNTLPEVKLSTTPDSLYQRAGFTVTAEAEPRGDVDTGISYLSIEVQGKKKGGTETGAVILGKWTGDAPNPSLPFSVVAGKAYYRNAADETATGPVDEAAVPPDAFYVIFGDGSYTFTARTRSNTNAPNQDDVNIYIDTQPPAVSVNSVTPHYSQETVTGADNPNSYGGNRRWTVNSTVKIQVSSTDNRGNAVDEENGYMKFKYLLVKDNDIPDGDFTIWQSGPGNSSKTFGDYLYQREGLDAALFFDETKAASTPPETDGRYSGPSYPVINVSGSDGAYELNLKTHEWALPDTDYLAWLYIVSQDNAGNTSYDKILLNVKQGTDDPTVAFNTIDSGGTTFVNESAPFRITLSDDDALDEAAVEYRFSKDGGTSWSFWVLFPPFAPGTGLSPDGKTIEISSLLDLRAVYLGLTGTPYGSAPAHPASNSILNILGSESEAKKIEIRAPDKLGEKVYTHTSSNDGIKTAEVKSAVFKMDLTAPKIVPTTVGINGIPLTVINPPRNDNNPFGAPYQEEGFGGTAPVFYGDITELNPKELFFTINETTDTYLVPASLPTVEPGGSSTAVWGTLPNFRWRFDTSAAWSGLPEGAHTFRLEISDQAGRSVVKQVTFFKDSEGPAINFITINGTSLSDAEAADIRDGGGWSTGTAEAQYNSVKTGAVIRDTDAKIFGSFVDGYSTVNSTFHYRVDSGAWQAGTTTSTGKTANWVVDVSGLSDGFHTLNIRAKDAGGNGYDSASVNPPNGPGAAVNIGFILDKEYPRLVIVSPYGDKDTDDTVYAYKTDGESAGTRALTVKGLAGDSSLKAGDPLIAAIDAAAANNTYITTQTLVWRGADAAAPASPAQWYAYRNTGDNKYYIHSGTAWEELGPVDPDNIYNPEAGEETVLWTYTLNVTQLDGAVSSDGSHKVTVTVREDGASPRTVTRVWNFVRDNTAPAINIISGNPADNNTEAASAVIMGSPKIQGTISDLHSEVAKLETKLEKKDYSSGWTTIQVSGQDWEELALTNGAWEKDLITQPDGQYRITVKAADNARVDGTTKGNSVELFPLYFIIDTQNPAIATLSDIPFRNKGFTLNGTVTDANTVKKISAKLGSAIIIDIPAPIQTTATSYNWTVDVPIAGATPEGSYAVTITAEDQAGRTDTKVYNFTYDKTPPTASIAAPGTGAQKNFGDLSNNGAWNFYDSEVWINGQVDVRGMSSDTNGIAKISYYLGKLDGSADGAVSTGGDTEALYTAAAWIDAGLHTGSPATGWSGGVYSWTLTENFNAYSIMSATIINNTGGGNTATDYYLPLYVKVEDVAGNIRVLHYNLWVDPDLDKPQVSIANPGNGATVGGEVRITGTASDDDWVYGVQIQIESGGTYYKNPADTWVNGPADGWIWASISGNTDKVVAWYHTINSDGLLNPALGSLQPVTIKVRAWDTQDELHATPLVEGSPKTIVVNFDGNVPTISDVQISRSGAPAEPLNMGIRAGGTFTISAKVRDEGGISSIRARETGDPVYQDMLASSPPKPGAWAFTPPTVLAQGSWDPGYKYFITVKGSGTPNWADIDADYAPDKVYGEKTMFKYKPGTTLSGGTGWYAQQATGTAATTGSATDPNYNTQFFEYTISTTYNSTTAFPYGKTGTYNLELQVTDNNTVPSPNVTMAAYSVQVDNYFPTAEFTTQYNASTKNFYVSGTAEDYNGSSGPVQGLERVLVYFQRGTSYMNAAGAAFTGTTYAQGKEAGDAAAAAPVSIGNFPVLTLTGGVWKSSHAMVIDKQELGADTDTDGDLTYAEQWEDVGAAKKWQARFDTTVAAMTDGPVIVHYVIMDQAGNARHYTQNIYIRNNPPLIREITLGTDLDADGAVGAWEKQEPIIVADITDNGPAGPSPDDVRAVLKSAAITSNFTARNSRLNFDLHTFGGNGSKHYRVSHVTAGTAVSASALTAGNVYSISFEGDTKWEQLGAPNGTSGTVFVATGAGTGTGTAIPYTKVASTVDRTLSPVTGTTGAVNYAAADWTGFTDSIIGDSTTLLHSKFFIVKVYDTTVTSGMEAVQSAHAVLINMDIDNTDETLPVTKVDPFYWNSAEDNSLYDNSKDKGHIELEGDLPAAAFNQTSGLRDRDPKVSGQISIRGTAFDNGSLDTLWVYLNGFTFTGGTTATINGKAYTQAATYSGGGNWTGMDRWSANGWKFTVNTGSDSDHVHDQTGHAISWRLDIDTAKISGVAATDREFRVIAQDKRPAPANTAAEDAAQTTAGTKTNRYRMDVVPYISKIETTLRTQGGLKNNNIRSADGKYSVIQGNTADFITVSGFNLNPGGVRVQTETQKNSYQPDAAPVGTILAFSGVTASRTSFKASNNSTHSGYLTVWTNGIGTLNNINNNNSKGSFTDVTSGTNAANGYNEENKPNREADRYITKNIRLTDDRYVRFYTVKKTGVKNGYYPNMLMNGNNPVFGYLNLSGGPNSAPLLGAGGGAGTYYGSHAMPQRAEFNADTAEEVYTEYLIKASIWDAMGMARDDGNRYYHATSYNRDGASFHLIYDRYAELYGNDGSGWGTGTTYTGYTGDMANDEDNNVISLETMNYGDGLLLDRYQYPKLIAKGNSITGGASVYLLYFDDNTTARNLVFRTLQIGTNDGGRNIQLYAGGAASTGPAYAQYTNFDEDDSNDSNQTDAGRLIPASDASKHFDMAVTGGNIVVIAYYDESAGMLKIKYSNAAVTGSAPTTAITWQNSPVVLPDYIGSYVSMVTGTANALHIAAFDAGDSDLKYIYVPNYTQPDYTAVTVDQYGSVGNWTQIKLNSSNVPYIAYYNATETGGRDTIKLAHAKNAVTSAANVKAGVDGNGYTSGDWEYMTVPAIDPPQGGSTKFQKVNLGFRTDGRPVLGYLGTNIEFSYPVGE